LSGEKKLRVDRRTLLLVAGVTVVLICANALPLKIPFIGEQESDGYMIKQGWPCAFREETRHRVFWEWRDLAIDVGVGVAIALAAGVGAEFTVRGRWRLSFRSYCAILALAALLVGINLHEHTDAVTTLRGWPVTALINDPTGIHHNRMNAAGLAIDLAVAAGVLGAAIAFARRRKITDRQG
jgi:hypothetical protein